jgi:tetratricopeptide (TPR) repeat protein
MKQVVIVSIVILLSLGFAAGQKKKAAVKPVETPTQIATQTPSEKVVKRDSLGGNLLLGHAVRKRAVASRWNDIDVVKDALYDMIVEDPANDSIIAQLAFIYYESQKYPSTVLVCQDLLARNPRNTQALEMSAVSYENLNILDRSLQSYESLFLLTNNSATLYKMAFIQYELKRFPESLTNCDILLSKPDAETLKVVFNDKDNKQKEYTVKVALLNLKGLVYKEQGDKVAAKKYFDEALKVAPDFVPARQGLESLK